jgi:M6 family metalloprotease-like protein
VLLVLSLTNATAQPESWVSLNTWYSPSRGDHSTTTEPGWQGSVGETRSPDYRFVRREGYALTPVETQRPDTVGLYGWYDSQRGDNWTTSQWPGTPGSMLSPNYYFSYLHGYAYTLPLAGTVPLTGWWSGPREDNRATSSPDWGAGLPSPDPGNGYGFVRTEGYVVDEPNQPPYDPPYFGFRTKTVNGRLARTTRPLLVVLVQYSDQLFRPPHTISYYRDLVFGGLLNSKPSIAGHFYWNSEFRFRWSEAGVVLISMPDDPSTPGVNESTFAYWASPAGAANVGKHGRMALEAASAQINFASYDPDANGIVEPDELAALVINSDPPGDNCGQTRGHQSFTTDGKTIGLSLSAVAQGVGFGTIVHELFHQLGADHIYGNPRINTGYTPMAATCAGEDVHQYFHADAWLKMRLGWLEPSVHAVNAPGSSDYLKEPHNFDAGPERAILLFDPTRQTSAGKEYFLLEARRPTTGAVDYYDRDVPGTGLVVWWVRTAPNSDEFIHFKKILPGPNGTFQTSIPAGSDDRLVDTNGDGVADQIQPGRDFILQSQSVVAGDDVVADDPALIYYGAPNRTWGTGRPWTSADGEIRLRYYDGTDSGILLQVGDYDVTSGRLPVEWRRESALRPRLDSISPGVPSCNRLVLQGVLPVNGPTRVNLISATGTVRQCEIDPLQTDLTRCVVRLPNDTPAGDYQIEMVNGSVRSNRLRYHLGSSIGRPAGTFAFDSSSLGVSESHGTFNISIRRSGGACGNVRVAVELTVGTATPGRDFIWSGNPSYVDFSDGQIVAQLAVPILQDTVDENLETALLRLVSASNGGVVSGVGTLTLFIFDDDPSPSISIADVTVTEGDTVLVFADVPMTLSAASERTITFTLSTADDSARAGIDYQPTNIVVTLPPGETQATQRIGILPDTMDEYDSQFYVNVSAPSGVVVADGQSRVTILDNDPLPQLEIRDMAVTESDSGIKRVYFQIVLSAESGKNVFFTATTEDGTARAGEDYEPSALTYLFDRDRARIPFTIIGRPGPEPDETFVCRLSRPFNATIARDVGTCTIKELRFLSIERDKDDIVLTLPSCLNERFHILRTPSLANPASATTWTTVTPTVGLPGTGSDLIFRDTNAAATGQKYFYRLSSELVAPTIASP